MSLSQVNGWLLLDKPIGISSARALAHIKRLCKPSKVGHAGTLDPFASGLLIVAIGEATKVINFAMNGDKEYVFTIEWGENRDTEDCDGEITAVSAVRPSLDEIRSIVGGFIGEQWQVPPVFSANKVNGKRAYDLARKGKKVELVAKKVFVHELEIRGHHGNSTDFAIKCGKGFYIRALARDIASKLGVCGHVSSLRRVSIGKFCVEDAIPLAKIEKIKHNDDRKSLKSLLRPVTAMLDDILVLQCNQGQARDLSYGRVIEGGMNLPKGGLVCLVVGDEPVALCEVVGGSLHPVRVFNIINHS